MKPVPFLIIDVRDKHHADVAPLPQEVGQVVQLPGLGILHFHASIQDRDDKNLWNAQGTK